MKKSICHYSFHRRYVAEGWDEVRLANEVKALGVGAVDYHVGFLGDPATAADRVKTALDETGVVLSGISMSNNFNQEEPQEFREQVDSVKTWLRVAAEIGTPVSRIFGGGLPADQRGNPALRAKAMPRVLDGLREVVAEAEKLGVVLAIENHGGLPCLGEEQVETIETINSPYLKAVIDIGNYMQGGQEAHVGVAVAAKHAAYVHLKDFAKVPDANLPWGWNVKATTIGEGDVDIPACIALLRAAGYDGFVALEYEGPEPEETAVPKSVAYMNQVL